MAIPAAFLLIVLMATVLLWLTYAERLGLKNPVTLIRRRFRRRRHRRTD